MLGHKGSLLSLVHNLPEGGVSVGNIQTDVPNVIIHSLDPLQGQGVKGAEVHTPATPLYNLAPTNQIAGLLIQQGYLHTLPPYNIA